MKVSKIIFVLILTCFATPIFSQKKIDKKPLDWQDIMKFKRISYSSLSPNSDFLIWSETPDRGNTHSFAINLSTGDTVFFENGRNPKMSDNDKLFTFIKYPDVIEAENAKKPDEKPKNGLYVYTPENNEKYEINDVISHQIANNGEWLAYQLSKESGKPGKNQKKYGEELYLKHIQTKTDIIIKDVREYTFDSLSTKIFYWTASKDKRNDGLYYRDLKKAFAPELAIEIDSNAVYANLTPYSKDPKFAFAKSIVNKKGKPTNYSVHFWDGENLNLILDTAFSATQYIPETNEFKWSDDGTLIYFGFKYLTEKVEENDDDKKFTDSNYYDVNRILEDAQIYVWKHDDNKIITNKQSEWKREKDKTYLSYYDFENKKYVQLADSSMSYVMTSKERKYAAGYDDTPYHQLRTYEGFFGDVYSIDFTTGNKTLIETKIERELQLSPLGRYILYFKDKHWHIYDNESKTTKNITLQRGLPKFWDYTDDRPAEPGSFGFGAWIDDDKGFWIYSEYDIWQYSIDNNEFLNLTKTGFTEQIKYRYLSNFVENPYLNTNDIILLSAFSNQRKTNHLLTFDFSNNKFLDTLGGEYYYRYLGKSKHGNKTIISKEKFELFPDIWVCNELISNPSQKTFLETQKEPYAWGTTEYIEWVSPNGDTLQGYIMKPDDFNPKKKYPVLVYFYEKFSDLMHRWSQPAINHRPCYPQYLASGYIIFMPDIKFYDGYPGKSGLDAILSGCNALIEKGYADKDKFCMQGHSWSGYQSAWFVTQTDFFKATVSGAPVGNMTSAYSGIRLESGLARQFQYETGQSRIGGNLIDSLSNYIENSPVFHANKATTPLMICFGDVDEAVPWHQGVELYLAFRRFNKECVFLQYEGEPHHLRKYHNKLDYASKMKDYFDHYIFDKPAPIWLKEKLEYKGGFMFSQPLKENK